MPAGINSGTRGISIHALLAESDHIPRQRKPSQLISIHALLAESDCGNAGIGSPITISIHALLAESDAIAFSSGVSSLYFYPRSPCGERPLGAVTSPAVIRFLSTLSLRRATFDDLQVPDSVSFLSTLSLRRATYVFAAGNKAGAISIHALLAESD